MRESESGSNKKTDRRNSSAQFEKVEEVEAM
jgi:hypothetical protein